jgi:hypothetical protein
MNPDYNITDEEYRDRLAALLPHAVEFTVYHEIDGVLGYDMVYATDDRILSGTTIYAALVMHDDNHDPYATLVCFPRWYVRKIELASGKVIYGQKNPNLRLC